VDSVLFVQLTKLGFGTVSSCSSVSYFPLLLIFCINHAVLVCPRNGVDILYIEVQSGVQHITAFQS